MDYKEISSKITRLLELFNCSDPDLDLIREVIAEGDYSPDELGEAFIKYLDVNMYEYADLLRMKHSPTEEGIANLHASSAPEILEILIENQIKLNVIYDDTCILNQLMFIDAPNISPALEKMVLENGGDGSIVCEYENFLEHLDAEIDFSMMDEDHHYRIEYLFTMYMIALGYGCTLQDGSIPVEIVDGFDLNNFKNYQNYSVESFEKDGRTLYRFYEKDTHKIVVIF